ncbi:MAG: hypothetical protein H0V82_07035 [Candidatus Protochlamydia sp.]|nr:hypothetical protein [Candidatus Protochlamydia sp.]
MENKTNIGLKQFFILFLPIAIITFSTNLFPAIEKFLLASLSKEYMEASLTAFYAIQVFQLATVSLAMMAQVFVGSWYGEKKWSMIGPGIWQFIWFSLFSVIITLPFGYLYGKFYFKGNSVEELAIPYYYFLLSIGFLFPLGAALTCFFLGQGKTFVVFLCTLIFHLIKLPIGYVLIFGWKWIPSLGIMGGAISIFITQLGFCLALLVIFLNKKNNQLFHTRKWGFDLHFFWECVQPGLLRAVNRLLTMANWGAITNLMAGEGDNYFLILSIGGSLFLFVSFLAEAICLTQMTVVSQILGSKNYQLLYSAFRPGVILASIASLILAINFLIFPNWTFQTVFPTIILEPSTVRMVFMGTWFSAALCIFSFLPISYVLAFKDTYFSLFMGCVNWITGYCFFYVVIKILYVSPNYFWLLLTFLHAVTGIFYFLRTTKLIESLKTSPVRLLFTNK